MAVRFEASTAQWLVNAYNYFTSEKGREIISKGEMIDGTTELGSFQNHF